MVLAILIDPDIYRRYQKQLTSTLLLLCSYSWRRCCPCPGGGSTFGLFPLPAGPVREAPRRSPRGLLATGIAAWARRGWWYGDRAGAAAAGARVHPADIGSALVYGAALFAILFKNG